MRTDPSDYARAPELPGRLRRTDPAGGHRIEDLFRREDCARHVEPGRTIFLHGDPARTLYQVIAGTVACCTIARGGRRQIFQFAGKGEILGLAEIDTWHFTGEAVDHVILRPAPRQRLESAIRADPALERAVRAHNADQLASRERHMVTIAYLCSEERLAMFLSRLAEQRATDGFVTLAMTRQQIGDHLGLTLETVSRAFSRLRARGLIETQGPDRFRIRTPAAGRAGIDRAGAGLAA